MGSENNLTELKAVERGVEIIVDRAEDYAEALLALVPELSHLTETDRAVVFDVGSGADLVALKKLGFQQVEWLNEPEPNYMTHMREFYLHDEKVRERP